MKSKTFEKAVKSCLLMMEEVKNTLLTKNFMHDPEYDAIQAAKAYMLLVSEE
jgi:hypothetical protein